MKCHELIFALVLVTSFTLFYGSSGFTQQSPESTPKGAAPKAVKEAPLSNEDIIKLSKLGLGDEIVIAKIDQAKEINFKLDTDSLINLKKNGVTDKVITAMLKRSSGSKTESTQNVKNSIIEHWKGTWTSQWNKFNPSRPRMLSKNGSVSLEISKAGKNLSGWIEFFDNTLVSSERVNAHGEIKTGESDFFASCVDHEKFGFMASYSNGATLGVYGCVEDNNTIKGMWNVMFKNQSSLPDGGPIILNRL